MSQTRLREVFILIKANSSMRQFSRHLNFSNFFINMLRAGELSGNLDEIMNDLAKYYAKRTPVSLFVTNKFSIFISL